MRFLLQNVKKELQQKYTNIDMEEEDIEKIIVEVLKDTRNILDEKIAEMIEEELNKEREGFKQVNELKAKKVLESIKDDEVRYNM